MFVISLSNFIYISLYHNNYFSTNYFNIYIGWLFILLGQVLNISVYYKLGVKGVYYGIQYKTVKFRKIFNEFPFYIYHPQYLGGVLSYIGVFLLFGYNNGGLNGLVGNLADAAVTTLTGNRFLGDLAGAIVPNLL